MISINWPSRFCLVCAFVLITPGFCVRPVYADTVYTASDGSFRFSYPQHWQAEDANGKIKVTASDGSAFLLQTDVLQTLPTQSPVNDAGLKSSAATLVSQVLRGATFVRASSLSMDHGLGALFRFKSASDTVADVWIGIIGKHSVVLLPQRAGQASQSIGLSVIFQTMSFTDALPKAPPPRQPVNNPPPVSGNGAATSGTKTVFFSKQIAPILSARCAACHSGGGASGGFDVSNYNTLMSGGVHGALVRAGNPASSKLIDYLTGVRDQMPKGSAPLSSDQINLFRTWISEGATNDLAPGGANSNPSLGQNDTGTPPRKKRRQNKTASGAAATRGARNSDANLLESYAGHLAANDTSFKLRLNLDGTATADWVFNLNSQAHYEGTYTETGNNDIVQLKLLTGSSPNGSKSLVIMMQEQGVNAVGKFGTDTTNPRLQISDLEVSEIGHASKTNPAAGGAGARRKR